MEPALERLADRIRAAVAARTPLAIRAGGTKAFYGNPVAGDPLDPREHHGIVAYEPTELVVSARAGTPLAQLEAELAAHGQMLPFEPPHFGADATVGGCVAAGLSGPRRASAGAVRDLMLGAQLLDGRGQQLRFGGTVMKNVAGYDMARALAGSLGTLGVIVEVSLKVLPRPAAEATLRLALDETAALAQINRWGGQPLPISATAWCGGALTLRLSGARAAVDEAVARLGGTRLDEPAATAFWRGIREQTDAYFAGAAPIWRLSVVATAPALGGAEPQLIEWGGALRWLRSYRPAAELRAAAAARGGHATLWRPGEVPAAPGSAPAPVGAGPGADAAAGQRPADGVFTPLAPPLLAIHRRLKAEFDPAGVFNRGRLYAEV